MEKEHARPELRKAYAAPLMAIVSAIGSLACCLPFAFLAASGTAGASAVFASFRPWLLVLSAVLLAIGFAQLYRGGKSCHRRGTASIALFWIAVVVFLMMLFFPQQVASLLAGHFSL
jgi:hypothetical protein